MSSPEINYNNQLPSNMMWNAASSALASFAAGYFISAGNPVIGAINAVAGAALSLSNSLLSPFFDRAIPLEGDKNPIGTMVKYAIEVIIVTSLVVFGGAYLAPFVGVTFAGMTNAAIACVGASVAISMLSRGSSTDRKDASIWLSAPGGIMLRLWSSAYQPDNQGANSLLKSSAV